MIESSQTLSIAENKKFTAILDQKQIKNLEKRAKRWGLPGSEKVLSQEMFQMIIDKLTLAENAVGGLRLRNKVIAQAPPTSNEPDKTAENLTPWSMLKRRRQRERLLEAGAVAREAFLAMEKFLNMRDDDGERSGLDDVVHEVLEYLLHQARGENRLQLTEKMVPTGLRSEIEKAHTKKLIYKHRYDRIAEWARVMRHLTAENYRGLATSQCIPRGMVPPYEVVQKYQENMEQKHLSLSRIYRTLAIGMQFDVKAVVTGSIASYMMEYPRKQLEQMLERGRRLRLMLQFGTDAFRADKINTGCVGSYLGLHLLPEYGTCRLIDFFDGNQTAARRSNPNVTATVCLFTNGENHENLVRNLTDRYMEEENLFSARDRIPTMCRDDLLNLCSRLGLPHTSAGKSMNKPNLIAMLTTFMNEPKNQVMLHSPMFQPLRATHGIFPWNGQLETMLLRNKSVLDAFLDLHNSKGVVCLPPNVNDVNAGNVKVEVSLHISLMNDMSCNNKASSFHCGTCKGDCLNNIYITDLCQRRCGKACMHCMAEAHNRQCCLVTLTLDEVRQLMKLSPEDPCTIQMISARFFMSVEQVARLSDGGFSDPLCRGGCNCSWIANGLTDDDPSATRFDKNVDIQSIQCSKGYAAHNNERVLQASTVVERRNLTPTLGLYLSKDEIWALRSGNGGAAEISGRNLSLLSGKSLVLALRLRMTWPRREINPAQCIHPIFTKPGTVNPPVLHHLLALSRFLVHLLQCAALMISKVTEFELKLRHLYFLTKDDKKSEYNYPNFLGPRAKQILQALAEGIVWVKGPEQDSFSMQDGKTWILDGLFSPSLQQAFMAASFFVNRELALENIFALTEKEEYELAAVSLETRVRMRALCHVSGVWADYMHAGQHGWMETVACNFQSRSAFDEAKFEFHHREVKRSLRLTMGGGAAGRSYQNTPHNGVMEKKNVDAPEGGDTFTSEMRLTGALRTLHQAMKREGRNLMDKIKTALEWQEQQLDNPVVEISENDKVDLSEQYRLQTELHMPPVISFDVIRAIPAFQRPEPSRVPVPPVFPQPAAPPQSGGKPRAAARDPPTGGPPAKRGRPAAAAASGRPGNRLAI